VLAARVRGETVTFTEEEKAWMIEHDYTYILEGAVW